MAYRQDGHESDRDGVDEAQGDRAVEGEDAAPAQGRQRVEQSGEVAALDDPTDLGAEGRVDDGQQEPPDRESRGRRRPAASARPRACDAGGPRSRLRPVRVAPAGRDRVDLGSVVRVVPAGRHRVDIGGVVRIELQERFLETGRLDGQVGYLRAGDRCHEGPDVALEVAAEVAVDGHDVGDAGNAGEVGGGPASRISTVRRRRARRAPISSRATRRPRRTIATRSQTRSTSERTWDERKTVRPAARRSSRIS